MLNDLYLIAESLERNSVEIPTLHPWIQPFPKGEALVADLDESSDIKRVRLLSKDETASLYNIRQSDQRSFPGFNLKTPLLKADFEKWKHVQNADSLSLDSSCALAYKSSDLTRIKGTISEFPCKVLESVLKKVDDPALLALRSLIQRVTTLAATPEIFIRRLAEAILSAADNGHISRDWAADVLFGKWNRSSASLNDKWRPTLIFDVFDLDRFPYSATDPKSTRAAGDALLGGDQSEEEVQICSLSSIPDQPFRGKFPKPSLGVLGPTYLMSMNKDAPCQERYGRLGSTVFRVGRATVLSLNDSATWISGRSNKGVTWVGVPATVGKGQDLCVAFLEEHPKAAVPLGGFFSRYEKEPQFASNVYRENIQKLFEAIRNLPNYSPETHVRILILHKLDKGRTQVELSGIYSVPVLHRSYSRWVQGCENLPKIEIPYPGKRKGELRFGDNYILTHADIIKCFKTKWMCSGTRAKQLGKSGEHIREARIPGVKTENLFRLYFESEGQGLSAMLLHRLLPMVVPLLIGLSLFLSRRDVEKKKDKLFGIGARIEAQRILALIGVLLHHQGRAKENYMSEREFLMGQFLQMADLLHKQYCKLVRGDQIPPQLVGNAAIAIAMQNPAGALSMLSSRLRVYLAWADRLEIDEEATMTNEKKLELAIKKKAKWARSELKEISDKLHNLGHLENRVDTIGKAELLLGYLAQPKKDHQTTVGGIA